MLNSMKKLQMFYAKSPKINLAPSPAEQAVHGVLFTFNLRTFGYRLLLLATNQILRFLQICETMLFVLIKDYAEEL